MYWDLGLHSSKGDLHLYVKRKASLAWGRYSNITSIMNQGIWMIWRTKIEKTEIAAWLEMQSQNVWESNSGTLIHNLCILSDIL